MYKCVVHVITWPLVGVVYWSHDHQWVWSTNPFSSRVSRGIPWSTRVFSIKSCPHDPAQWRQLRPLLSVTRRDAPCCMRHSTTSLPPISHARNKGVWSLESTALISAPCCMGEWVWFNVGVVYMCLPVLIVDTKQHYQNTQLNVELGREGGSKL